ncbi:MAG: GIY-YIG nuclease family protein [Patescibacteria group bacterium]
MWGVGVDRFIMKAFVYILKDQGGKFYIGSTINLERRLHQHSTGHTQTTRNMIKPVLVLKQEYETLQIARSIEEKIKKLKRKDYIEKMIRDGYIKIKPGS